MSLTTVCQMNACNGCMACADICPQKCINIKDEITHFNAYISSNKCIGCKLCEQVCSNIHMPEKNKPIECYDAWANNNSRKAGSSGGLGTELILSFVKAGGYVASCIFENGQFKFYLTNKIDELSKFSGSKYVKSDASGIYKSIKQILNTSLVLFIGLPCQVAAVKNYTRNHKNLYCVDLICHGTPSVKVLDMFLHDYNTKLVDQTDIKFRNKTIWGTETNLYRIKPFDILDEYMIAFLHGSIYTENCYSCRFAEIERVSDLTLGDSWGSDNIEQKPFGISLVLIQTEKGRELLSLCDVQYMSTDLNRAVEYNHQLNHPSVKFKNRDKIMKNLVAGYSFKGSILKYMPKQVARQKLKYIAIKIGLKKPGGVRNNFGL